MIDKKIMQKEECMGCAACSNICPQSCIDMEADGEGFLYPVVDYSLCIKCSRCIKVCPIINKAETGENNPLAFSCMNKDEAVRLESSSGGIFSLLAEKVLSQGGVVFGAAFNDSFEVEHRCIDSKEALSQLRGSKYVQSRIGYTYKEAEGFLKKGRKVLFSGTPCQIGGLKSYLGRPYENLLCVDIICHGVPSPAVWRKYIKYREDKSKSFAEKISFRQKGEGWKKYSVAFTFKDNTVYRQILHKDLYMRAFLKNICLRPSCYDCRFKGLNRQSDITLADFWGIQRIMPEMDDDKGTSLVIVHSKSGEQMLKGVSEQMRISEVDINKAVKYNLAAVKSAVMHPNRESFFNDLERLNFNELVKKYCTDKLLTRIRYKAKALIKAFLANTGLLNVARKLLR